MFGSPVGAFPGGRFLRLFARRYISGRTVKLNKSLSVRLEAAGTGLSRTELQALVSNMCLPKSSEDNLNFVQISKLVVAASEANWYCDWLLSRLELEHSDHGALTGKQLVELLKALARLEYNSSISLTAIGKGLATCLDDLDERQCSDILCSLAALRWSCGIVVKCAERLQSLGRSNLSTSLWSSSALANLTCAWVRLSCYTHCGLTLLRAIAAVTVPIVETLDSNDLVRMVGSLCSVGLLEVAWQMYTKAQRAAPDSSSGLRGLVFHACERNGNSERALTVLAHLAIFSRVNESRTWRRALVNVAVLALLRTSGPRAAANGHRALAPLVGDDAIVTAIARRLGTLLGREVLQSSRPHTDAVRKLCKVLGSARSSTGADQRKEFALLRHVCSHAKVGDATSVLEAAEHYANRVTFLKMAGGAKRLLLEQVANHAPEGLIIELGTYVGYSAIVLGLRRQDSSVITVELDPTNAVVAKNLIELAGLSERIDTWIGNSGDVAGVIRVLFGVKSVALLFMDHRGSIFHDDLRAFEFHNLFKDNACIVADNVLKPGAPRFLWHIHQSNAFDVDLVEVPEFGLGHACLEDWVAVCRYHSDSSKSQSDEQLRACPARIATLAREADDFRKRTLRGNVSIDDWAAHAAAAKDSLKSAGISPTGHLTETGHISRASK